MRELNLDQISSLEDVVVSGSTFKDAWLLSATLEGSQLTDGEIDFINEYYQDFMHNYLIED